MVGFSGSGALSPRPPKSIPHVIKGSGIPYLNVHKIYGAPTPPKPQTARFAVRPTTVPTTVEGRSTERRGGFAAVKQDQNLQRSGAHTARPATVGNHAQFSRLFTPRARERSGNGQA